MSKIIRSKSKVAKRYDADIWNFLLRETPKLNKATNLFSSLGRSSFTIGSEVFAGITRRLYMSKLRRRNVNYKLLRNKARLRLFLGGVNNQHLKTLSKKCWRTNIGDANAFYVFESRLDAFLYRAHFVESVKEAPQLLKLGYFTVNGVVVKHPAYALKIGDRVDICNFEYKTKLFLKLVSKMRSNSILWYVPPYIEVNYRLFSAKYLRFPVESEVLYPYSINLLQAIDFYKTNT